MRKLFRLLCVLLLSAFAAGVVPVYAVQENDRNNAPLAGITAYEMERAGASDMDAWVETALPEEIGITAEWYVLALSSAGDYDFTAYAAALTDYVKTENITSPVTKQKFALALLASGYTSDFVAETVNGSVGKLGIMSWVWALHLAANGYVPEGYSAESITEKLLSFQLSDGGFAVSGTVANADVTAMVLQALAHSKDAETTASAIEKALACLSDIQTENGGFESYGVENAESTAQVIIALCALGMDIEDTRFIKNGNTLVDALLAYQCKNGGFSHEIGADVNTNATVQAYLAFSALENGSFYHLKTLDSLTYIETETEEAPQAPEKTGFPTWRITAMIVIWSAALLACAVCFLLKKRNYKNFLMIVAVATVLTALVFVLNFQSADDYYGSTIQKDNPVGTVTLSIRCDILVGKTDLSYVPEDGIILAPTVFSLAEGETVFDILTEAAKTYQIHMEYRGGESNAYIEGIGYLYELAHGDLSGWVYHVNGESPSVGCGAYTLKDGDEIVWHYTLATGEDIK